LAKKFKLHPLNNTEDENSLERIHTFNLRSEGALSSQQDSHSESDSLRLRNLLEDGLLSPSQNTSLGTRNTETTLRSVSTRDNVTSPKRLGRERNQLPFYSCYVEEQTRGLDLFVLQAFRILRSLAHRFRVLEKRQMVGRSQEGREGGQSSFEFSSDALSSISS